jgi:septum formation protein
MFRQPQPHSKSSDESVPLVLASASPRRRSLLEAAGLRFSVEPSHVDEEFDPHLAPATAAELLAERKARAAAVPQGQRARWVIAADTLVALPWHPMGRPPASPAAAGLKPAESRAPQPGPPNQRYLGKPADAAEAREFLSSLSGSSHSVVTGVAVWRCRDGRLFVGHAETRVHMRVLTAAEIDAYVASGEWQDKAGGYAIQESADAFVTNLEGDFDTVVGLPVTLTLQLLAQAGAPLPEGLIP